MSSTTVFTRSHYNSNNGYLTTVWGPMMWFMLHTMSFNYPVHPTQQQQRQYRSFVYQLRYVLPCGKCRLNLTRNLKEFPLTWKHMASRDTFSHYIYELHNVINKMLHKPCTLTYTQVRSQFEHFRARCASNQKEKKEDKEEKEDKEKMHAGCMEPALHGKKSKSVIHIVPVTSKSKTLTIHPRCLRTRTCTRRRRHR